MRIAQLAPPFESVPPTRYGGTERVVALLVEELGRRGHEITLFASGDSTARARLIPTVETALWLRPEPGDSLWYCLTAIGDVYERAAQGEFDLVHTHLGGLALPCARLAATPTVATLHGRLDLPGLARLYEHFSDVPIVSISSAQRGSVRAGWVRTVYNAVDVERLRFNPRGGGYLAFLGRVSPEKGLDRAIRIARRADIPIRIAARMPIGQPGDPRSRVDWEYYAQVVAPLLREPGVQFLGEIGEADKAEFLGNARALLFPVDWPEPFGLVMAEALACGTPVVARRRGAVPEVLTEGVTGLIGETEEELARLCGQVDRLSRETCRAEAVRRFSPQVMADGYEAAYRAVLARAERTNAAASAGPAAASNSGALTERQTAVATLIAHGRTNRQIADELGITIGTAANHVERIMTRLNLHSRAQIAAWAAQQGLYGPRAEPSD